MDGPMKDVAVESEEALPPSVMAMLTRTPQEHVLALEVPIRKEYIQIDRLRDAWAAKRREEREREKERERERELERERAKEREKDIEKEEGKEGLGEGEKEGERVNGEGGRKRKGEGGEGDDERAKKKPKQNRNKSNRQAIYEMQDDGKDFCSRVLQGGVCGDEKCKKSHDVAAYLLTKPPDLSIPCPRHHLEGHCNFGVRCRCLSSHTPLETPPVSGYVRALNELPGNVMKQLWRKGQYKFERTAKVMAELKNLKKDKHSSSAPNPSTPAPSSVSAPPAPSSSPASSPSAPSSVASNPSSKVENLEPALSGDNAEREMVYPTYEKKVDFTNKLILSPLATVGNLPFRRICKRYGADITCCEMAMCDNLNQGKKGEWALLKRHPSEDIFGVQVAANHIDQISRTAELISKYTTADYIDINCGCPTDVVCNRGMGAALLERPGRMEELCRAAVLSSDVPVTLKTRAGLGKHELTSLKLFPHFAKWGLSAVTLHGRTQQQRYTKRADWDYIGECARATPLPIIGNGDVYNWEQVMDLKKKSGVTSFMIGRGALIKPWIFKEIKDSAHYDIPASERLDIVKDYCSYGLEHWGSDSRGVEMTRHFLLNWISFLHRYHPIGILDDVANALHLQLDLRPPTLYFRCRGDLETLLASPSVTDWIKISEMFLGPAPPKYTFQPKHRANAYSESFIV